MDGPAETHPVELHHPTPPAMSWKRHFNGKVLRDELYFPWSARDKARDQQSKDPVYQDAEANEGLPGTHYDAHLEDYNEDGTPRTVWGQNGKAWPVMTAGAGLFSDGYVNNSMGTVTTVLKRLYGKEYSESRKSQILPAIVFVGTVVGMLVFGYVADYHSRKLGMVISTLILILFTILCAGSWGAGGKKNMDGMLAALITYRFFMGIGLGGEYPAGSVACAEASAIMGRGTRNRWFILFTNFMIDFGFVCSAFVPCVLWWIFHDKHLQAVWRLTLGLGAIPPLGLFYLRTKFKENPSFMKNNFKRTRFPYWLAIKYYGVRLACVSLIWFIYDWASYSFGLYTSPILANLNPNDSLIKNFGYTTIINLWYLPGSFLGAICADYLGPRLTLIIGVVGQAIVGYVMAGIFEHLRKPENVAGFICMYGVFLALGEFGPGDQIGLIASKTCATPIRGQYYAIAAAIGKIGAFVGTYCFPAIQKSVGNGDPDSVKGQQGPFWVSCSMNILSAILAYFLLPSITQETIQDEDRLFREYLIGHGFDVSLMGDVEFAEAAHGSSEDQTEFKEAQEPHSSDEQEHLPSKLEAVQ